MKLKAHLLDQDFELAIDLREDQIVATIDDRTYSLEVRRPSAGEYLLVNGREVSDCYVANRPDDSQLFEVHINGHTYETRIIDPKRLRSGQASSSQNHGAAKIVAPMPGKVVRVLVELGAEVEVGSGVIVVEAMKMQNEMKAPKSGKVVSMSASAGSTVNAGDVLAVIE